MTSVWSKCLDYFQTDEAKRNLKESVISPVGKIIYHELYCYVWLICFYHVFLILLILCILVLLLRGSNVQYDTLRSL
jgi:hypothetical protein